MKGKLKGKRYRWNPPWDLLLFYLVSVAYVQGHESVQDTFVKSSIVIHFWRWTIILRNLRKMWSSAVTAVVVAGLELDTKYWCALQWWKISWNHTETTKDESSSHVWTPASPGLNLLWHKADCDHYGSECGARSSAQWSHCLVTLAWSVFTILLQANFSRLTTFPSSVIGCGPFSEFVKPLKE